MDITAKVPGNGALDRHPHQPGRLFSKIFRISHGWRLFLACLFGLLALLLVSQPAQAQSAVNGSALFHGATYACYSCHSTAQNVAPRLPQLNAAGVTSVLSHAIANNAGASMGAFAGLTTAQRDDIVAYLQTVVDASFPASVAVPYHGSTSAIPLKLDITTGRFTSISYGSPARGSVAAGTPVTYSSLAGTANLSESTAVYTHTANNCTADSFNVTATGAGGTSTARTINITVTPPASPTASTAGPIAAAYNTGTAIPITLGGGATSSIEIVSGLSNGGSLVTNGTTSFTYTSNAATYSATDSFTYRAVGPCGATSSNVVVNINISAPPTPVVTSAGTASGNGGQAFSYQITASNLPTSYSVTGTLPGGVTVNTSTGLISGTTTETGVFPVTVNAINSSGTGSQALTITISPVTPVITSNNTAAGNGGQVFSHQITASNLPTSYSVTGALPAGVSLNTGTGLISGTPTQTGSFPVTVSASNAAGSGNQVLTITIALVAPSITSATTTNGNGGQAFSYQITADNLPSAYSVTGSLPAGVSLNAGTGLISGAPTQTGSFPVTVGASNGSGSDTQALTITIALVAPTITSAGTASGNGGQAFSYQITAGNLPTSYGVTGTLPAGVSVNTGTGLISGTPTQTGSFPVTISASNASGTGNQALTITIALVTPVITSANTASATGGQVFSYQITADNLPTSFGVTGTLPAGLSVNAGTGIISGTPSETGSFPVTITATNASGTGNQALTITVSAVAPVITSAGTASGNGGQAFSYQITAANLPSSYGVTGALPAGVSLNTTSGLISGTPTATGSFPVTIAATNASGTGTQALTITIVTVAPVITSAGTASGTGGQPFSYQITAGNLPSSYSVTGSLPAGVSLNTSTGLISGAPSTTGSFPVTINAHNAAGVGSQALTITIALVSPTISSATTAAASGGQAFSYQIVAANLPTSYSVTGALPAGVSVNTSTGQISGTPTVLGSFPVTINASNAAGTGSQALTITVSPVTPVVTSANTASGSGGQAFSYQITASHLPSSFGVTGALPAGVSVNTTTGLISGTPSVTGSFPVTVHAANAAGTGSQALTITVSFATPVITSANTATATGGQAFSYQITADNLPSTYGLTGALPAGVNINTSTGLISGTPGASGSFPVTISATNASGTGNQALTITVSLATPVVTSANTASGTSGQAFSYQITASNLPASYAATGLPPGVTVNTSTGLVSGTPSIGGTFNATISAINGAGTGSQALTINLAFIAPGAAAATANVPYQTATAINLPVSGQFTQVNITTAPTNGSVPTPAANSASVTYTPQAGFTGEDSFFYTATGPGGTSAPAKITINVDTLAPTATAASMTVQLNTAGSLDLAPYITGSGITHVELAAQPAHGTTTISGTTVTYTPANNYFGADSFSYTAIGNGGSASAAVNVTVAGRPDLSKDPEVIAIAASQVESAQRFARAQISNFQMRMEGLHHRSAAAARTSSAAAGNGAAAPGTAATGYAGNVSIPGFGVLPGRNSAPAPQLGSALNSGAYKPAATLSAASLETASSHALPPESALPTLVAALAAGGSQGGNPQAAEFGNALLAAAGALQSRSLNFNYSSDGGGGGTGIGLPDGLGVWLGGGVRFGSRDRGARNGGMSFTTDGISMGVDRRFRDDLTLGLGLGFAQDQTDVGTDGTNSQAKSFTLAAYGSYQPTDHTFIDGMLGYGALKYQTDRYVAPISTFARSDRSGNFVFGSLTGGYEYRTAGMLLSPYGRLDLANLTLDAATETGAGAFSLTYAKQTTPSVQFSLGLRAETAHETSFGWALPRVRVEFQHEFKGDRPALVTYADLVGPYFALPANAIDRNSVVLGVGSDFLFGRGLTLSLDYQMQRASGQEETQGIFFKLRKDLDGTPAPAPAAAFVKGSLRIDTEFAATYDDNVGRAELDADRYGDYSYNLDLSRRFFFPLGERARLLLKAFAGGDKFRSFSGLDRVYAGGEATLQYRPEGSFGSPTYGVFANLTASEFESAMRDGYRYSAGVSVHKPLTDRINLFGALSHNAREGKSAIFDNKELAARINLDYALPASTLYLSGEFRRGDIISSGTHTLSNISIAEVFARDDVFTAPQLYSYRFEGNTVLFTLGYSLPLGQKDALDFSWRRVASTPSLKPFAAPRPRYTVNQFSIVYLTSF